MKSKIKIFVMMIVAIATFADATFSVSPESESQTQNTESSSNSNVNTVVDPTIIIADIRVRLDSIELEVQGRKRLGQPISELETAATELRDSLAALRAQAEHMRDEGTLPPPQRDEIEKSFWSQITDIIPEGVLTFRPKDIFDWVIVITGGVALLCFIILIIGLIVTKRKPKTEKLAAKKSDIRKMNLAPQTVSKMKVVEDAVPPPPPPPARPRVEKSDVNTSENLQSLVEHLRNLSPQQNVSLPPDLSTMPTMSSPTTATSPITPPPSVPSSPPRPAPPPSPPQPLFAEVSPPDVSKIAPPSAGGSKINVQVFAAADAGMNEFEIAKTYKLSIDEVRLMLRMKRF